MQLKYISMLPEYFLINLQHTKFKVCNKIKKEVLICYLIGTSFRPWLLSRGTRIKSIDKRLLLGYIDTNIYFILLMVLPRSMYSNQSKVSLVKNIVSSHTDFRLIIISTIAICLILILYS